MGGKVVDMGGLVAQFKFFYTVEARPLGDWFSQTSAYTLYRN